MIEFYDGLHCHWTYQIGEYRTFLTWRTEQDAQNGLRGRDGEVFQVHSKVNCKCDKTDAR